MPFRTPSPPEWLKRLRANELEAAQQVPDPQLPTGAIAVIVNGFKDDEIELILDRVEDKSTAARMWPLVLTHRADLRIFRKRRLAVEQLVDPRLQPAANGLDWQLRTETQLARIVAHWQPIAAASFSRPPQVALLARLRAEIERNLERRRAAAAAAKDDDKPPTNAA